MSQATPLQLELPLAGLPPEPSQIHRSEVKLGNLAPDHRAMYGVLPYSDEIPSRGGGGVIPMVIVVAS